MRLFAIAVLLTVSTLGANAQSIIKDAATNPIYFTTPALSQAEPWTECGPRLWHRAQYITMTADQAIKSLGFGQACGYEGYRGGNDKGSDGAPGN